MKKEQRAEAVVETVPEDASRPDGATDIYLIFDGRRIAKRGKRGTHLKVNLGGAWSSKSIMCVRTDQHRFRCHVISQPRCSDLLRAE